MACLPTLVYTVIYLATIQLHPISQVGIGFKKSVESSKMVRNQDVIDTIAYIEKFGIEGVNKYD